MGQYMGYVTALVGDGISFCGGGRLGFIWAGLAVHRLNHDQVQMHLDKIISAKTFVRVRAFHPRHRIKS